MDQFSRWQMICTLHLCINGKELFEQFRRLLYVHNREPSKASERIVLRVRNEYIDHVKACHSCTIIGEIDKEWLKSLPLEADKFRKTNAEYIRDGFRCPRCNSEETEQIFNREEMVSLVRFETRCKICGLHYIEISGTIGYEELPDEQGTGTEGE